MLLAAIKNFRNCPEYSYQLRRKSLRFNSYSKKLFFIFLKSGEIVKRLLLNLAIFSLVSNQLLFVVSSTANAAANSDNIANNNPAPAIPNPVISIIPDGTTNTQIDRAANGVTIINVAAPNAGGLSHNRYSNIGIDQRGAVFNNAVDNPNGVYQSQIGGLIMDNPNLKAFGPAKIILNESTGRDITRIYGTAEVAQHKADLIFSNNYGFEVNGGSFINVDKLSLVVGTPNQFNPHPQDLTFALSKNADQLTNGFLPKLTIIGNGLDVEKVNSTELVANLMNIVAPIYAANNEVNLRAGDKLFNYTTKEVTSDNTTLGSNLPDEVAIDASALGKVQAGRIFIIATKQGFGIKYSADLLASRSGIVIDALGNIEYNNASSELGNIEVTSHQGSINNNGTSYVKDANSNLRLDALGDITNSKELLSAGSINLQTAKLTNQGKIVGNDLNIAANHIDNTNNQEGLIARNNLILKTNYLNNEKGKIRSTGNLQLSSLDNTAITSKITTTALTSTTNFNNIQLLNNNGVITTGNLDFDLGSFSDYLATGAVKANGYIKIKARQIANQGQIEATGNIELTSDTDFTNGYNLALLKDNPDLNDNIKLISGVNLTITALNLENYGMIAAANNLTTNLGNNLNNYSGGLIYAKNDMELNVVNNLINNQGASIYAENNLTIQKYNSGNPLYNASNNRINKLDNLSAEIIAYNGNLNLDANEINNKRASIYTQEVKRWMDDLCADCEHENHYDLHEKASYFGTITKEATIYAGNNININSSYSLADLNQTKLTNQSSSITAKNDINLKIGTLNNHSNSFKSYTKFEDYWWYGRGDWNLRLDNAAYIDLKQEDFPATFKAGHDINWQVLNNISNEDLIKNTPIDPRSKKTPDLLSDGRIDPDFYSYLNGPNTQGLFQRSTNPNSPLFETRSPFIDQSQFFGSNYFYTRIGFNLNDVQTEFEQNNKRLIGDQFFQTKIIEEQLRTISKNSFLLSATETNINNEIKNLIDNAADEYSRLGLNYNQALTKNQINSLQKDIIWFETEIINGAAYIVPKIYLSEATRTALKNGNIADKAVIYAGNDLNLTSTTGKINNQGSITGKNVTLLAANDITNQNFSSITANNNLSLTSTSGSITNLSQIKATNALSLTAAKDIINSSTVSTNDYDLLNSNNPAYIRNGADVRSTGQIQSQLIETAAISGGSININAGNDFTNHGAKITTSKNTLADGSTSSGNMAITAGDDITIDTLALRDRTETKWGNKKKGGTSITDNTTNVGSEISSAGNLSLTTTGLGTNNEKALVDQKFAVAQTKYNSDLVVYNQAVADYPAKLAAYNDALAAYNAAKSAGGFKRLFAVAPIAPEVPVAPTAPVYSKIMASIDNGGSDIKISGSNITTTTSGANININANNSVNIASAVDSSYKMESYHKKGTIVQKSSVSINSSTTNKASNINSLGDLSITSGLDTNITAANISGSGSGSIISGGNTNIFNAVDNSYSYSESTKTRTGLIHQIPGVGEAIKAASTFLSVNLSTINGLTGGNLLNMQKASGTDNNKNSLTNGSNNQKLIASNLQFGNNLTIASNVDLTVKASNLETNTGDITLGANNDVKILSNSQTANNNNSHREKSDRAKSRGNTENTNITNIASVITSGSDLNIISGNNTSIQSSKLSAGDNLTVNSGNNLLLLAANDVTINTHEGKSGTAYTFSNNNAGLIDVKAANNEITSNTNNSNAINSNLNLNANNSILAQYRASSMSDVLSSTNNQNQQLAYLKTINDLANSNPNKVTLDPIADNIKQWDDMTRGLTGAGTAVVAVAAIVATVATAGTAGVAVAGAAGATTVTATGAVTLTATGSFIAASTTAAITATAATASVSATNASMNTDSSIWGSTKSITSKTWRDTTSDESLRNIAIAAAVAGAASWAVNASGGTTSLEKGGDVVYKPDPKLIEKYPEQFRNYNGVIDSSANNIGIANTSMDISQVGQPIDYSKMNTLQKVVNEGGFISNNANKIPGINGMSTFHDPLTNNVFFETVPFATQITIPPAIAVEYCAISPAACGVVVSGSMNNQFGTKK